MNSKMQQKQTYGLQNKKKRLLFVIHGYPPHAYGGIEINTKYLAENLKDKFDIFIFSRLSNKDKEDFTIIDDSTSNVAVTYIVNNYRWQGARFTDRFISKKIDGIFADYIDRIKPDIVHIQHLLGLSTGIMRILNERKIPILISLHDYWFGCHRTNLITNLELRCECLDDTICCVDCAMRPEIEKLTNFKAIKWFKQKIISSMRKSVDSLKDQNLDDLMTNFSDSVTDNLKAVLTRRLYLKNLLAGAKHLLVPSLWLQRVYERFGFDFDNYLVMPCGCFVPNKQNSASLDSNSYHIDSTNKSPINIAYMGTLRKVKGVHILIEACKALYDKGYTKDDMNVIIYGDGSDESYKNELFALSKDYAIEFKGAYDHESISKIMTGIDILVIPSLWHETYSMIIREAHLCGLPVITTDLEAQKSGITDNKSGLLVKPGDPDDLAKKIEFILKNKDCLKNARRYIQENEVKKIILIDDYALQLSELYLKLI
jgi:glycosyltransferase involved in cell wall biosynthesis